MNPELTRRQIFKYLGGIVFATFAVNSGAENSRDVSVEIPSKINDLNVDRSIPLRILIPNGCGENIRPVINHFQEKTGIVIEIVETPVDDINAQLFLDHASSTGQYDLALPATFGVPDLVAAGAIVPLSDYAEKYEPGNFRDPVLYNIGDSFDGEIYGFQTDGDAYVMFYHKGMMQDENYRKEFEDLFGTELQIPQTWEELDRQMGFFHRPEEGIAGGLLYRTPSYLAWEWWVRFHAKGYWPLSPDLTPQIDSDAGVEALEEMIRASDHLAPEVTTLGLFDNWKRFDQANVFCNIGWGGTQKYLNREDSLMKNQLLFGPTPGGIVDGELLRTPYFNWGWNYVVTSSSSRPELAYLFALFSSSSAMSTLSVQQSGGFFDPFRVEHYDDPTIKEIYSSEFLDVHRASMDSAIPDLYLASQGDYFKALTGGLTRAYERRETPKAALKRVSDQWSIISEQGNLFTQQQRWRELRRKYPEKIRHRLKDII